VTLLTKPRMEVVHKNLNEMVSNGFVKKMLPVLIIFNVIEYSFEIAAVVVKDLGAIYYGFYGLELVVYGIFSMVYGCKILSWLGRIPVEGRTSTVNNCFFSFL
jgi:hypothetical protein